MFKDTQEELKRLEAELLAQEQEEKALEAQPEDDREQPTVYSNYSNRYGRDLRNYASGYRAYNTDRSDPELEAYSETVQQPDGERSRGVLPLALTALVLLTAIVAVLAWLTLRVRGAVG